MMVLPPDASRDLPGRARPYRLSVVAQNVGCSLEDESGVARVLRQIVGGLAGAGHEVRLLALQGTEVRLVDGHRGFGHHRRAATGVSGRRPFRLAERAVRRGQRTLRLPYLALIDSVRFYEACLRALPGDQLCHEFVGLLSPAAALACSRLGIPYLLSADGDILFEREAIGQPLRGLQRHLATWAIRLNYRSARRIICVSQVARELLLRRWGVPPEKVVVLPNGVDVGRFGRGSGAAVRARWGIRSDEAVVLFVGSFQPWHGVDRLVAAFEPIHRERPATRLLLVGEGPVRASLEATVERLGLSGAVTMTGSVAHREIPDLLAAADVVTVPYPRLPEPLWFSPLKLFEAMAAGRAIVASRDGQVAEVLRDGETGRLVEPGDEKALAEGILALLDRPSERARLGANARRQAVAAHSWERYIASLEAIYDEIAPRAPS